jgi:hypothetical protein
MSVLSLRCSSDFAFADVRNAVTSGAKIERASYARCTVAHQRVLQSLVAGARKSAFPMFTSTRLHVNEFEGSLQEDRNYIKKQGDDQGLWLLPSPSD